VIISFSRRTLLHGVRYLTSLHSCTFSSNQLLIAELRYSHLLSRRSIKTRRHPVILHAALETPAIPLQKERQASAHATIQKRHLEIELSFFPLFVSFCFCFPLVSFVESSSHSFPAFKQWNYMFTLKCGYKRLF